MRNRTPAKSAASSPPAPARISRMTSLSSFGSDGRSSTVRRCSYSASSPSRDAASSRAIAASSGSPGSAAAARSSSYIFFFALYSRKTATISSSFAWLRAYFMYWSGSATTAGSDSFASRSRYFSSRLCNCSSILIIYSPYRSCHGRPGIIPGPALPLLLSLFLPRPAPPQPLPQPQRAP